MKKIVSICGLGAIGSHVAQFLRNEDVLLRLIDFDRVEAKNVQAQFHSKTSIRGLKTNAVGQIMQFMFGTVTEKFPARLSEGNVNELLRDSALVIDCFDNIASRSLIQQYGTHTKTSVLHGGMAALPHAFGRIGWDTGFQLDAEQGGQATCEDGGASLPFHALMGALMAQAAKDFLRNGVRRSYVVAPTSVTSY